MRTIKDKVGLSAHLADEMMIAVRRFHTDDNAMDEDGDIAGADAMFTAALKQLQWAMDYANSAAGPGLSEGYMQALVTAARTHDDNHAAVTASKELAEIAPFKSMRELRGAYMALERSGDTSTYTRAAMQSLADSHNRAHSAMRQTPEWDAYFQAASAASGAGWSAFDGGVIDVRELHILNTGHIPNSTA